VYWISFNFYPVVLRAAVASQHHCSSSVFSSLVMVSADMVVFIVHKNVIKMYLTFTYI